MDALNEVCGIIMLASALVTSVAMIYQKMV